MKTNLIKIGNSRGIRIPKPIIDQCGIGDSVELEVHDHELLIRPVKKAREGWDGTYQGMAEAKDDQWVDGVTEEQTRWDDEEWEW